MIEDDLQKRIITLEVEIDFFITRIKSLEDDVLKFKKNEAMKEVLTNQKNAFVEFIKRDWWKLATIVITTLLFFGDIMDYLRDIVDSFIFH